MVTTVNGVARNVDWQTVPTEERISRNPINMVLMTNNRRTEHEPRLQFRVEEVDETGNPTGYTSVVASASSPDDLPDFVADGDEVAVTGTVSNGPMEAYEITNLTTDTTVTLQRRWGRLRWLGGLVLWLVVALLVGFVLALLTGAGLPGSPLVMLVVGFVLVFLIRWLWR